jgi:hypothetical protein
MMSSPEGERARPAHGYRLRGLYPNRPSFSNFIAHGGHAPLPQTAIDRILASLEDAGCVERR